MSRRETTAGTKRAPLNMRTTPELRDRLQKSADARGLSITQEVARRIEESFQSETADLNSVSGSDKFLLSIMADALSYNTAKNRSHWTQNPHVAMTSLGVLAGVAETIVTPPTTERIANRLQGQSEEDARKELYEAGQRLGRIFAYDRWKELMPEDFARAERQAAEAEADVRSVADKKG